MGKQVRPVSKQIFPIILPEIRSLIEMSRQHVAVTANLALVNLYWNIGQVITRDIQKNEKRARYGEQLIEELGGVLSRDYGQGFSARNLWDMKRFYTEFLILQPVAAESQEIRQTLSNQFEKNRILQPLAAESQDRLPIDFRKQFHLGWTHYRILLGISEPLKRKFYFEQTARQRWSKRGFQKQIDGALFERVALSRDTRKLASIERRKGPKEVVRYEDIFKDPYLLDFLGLKGAYSEKDLEAAIIHNLEQFLTELGSDFCFIGRQYQMRIDDVD
jgi:predicted nuclease of restriction endonuclease-like (RecB) superfamily